MGRPTGVAIIAVLVVIGGVIMLIAGVRRGSGLTLKN